MSKPELPLPESATAAPAELATDETPKPDEAQTKPEELETKPEESQTKPEETQTKPKPERLFEQKSSSVFCKICHSGASYERLLHPCFCKGSVGNVHLSCLERWINECGVDQCELCRYQFTSEQTRRYTMWRSILIWVRNPVHRGLIYSDATVMFIMTLVVAILIVSLSMGMTMFHNSGAGRGADLMGHSLMYVLISCAIAGYTVSMYSILRDNIRPWYRWYRNCNDIRLNRERLSGPVSA